jgi:hypothetical protein
MLSLALLAATSVAFPVYDLPAAIALSGESVLWVAPTRDGQVVVNEAPLAGGRPRVVVRIRAANPTSMSLAANASGFVVAVRQPGAERIEGRFGGVRRTLVDCAPVEPPPEDVALTVVAGRSGFAFAGARCGAAPVELIGADGARTPVPDLRVYPNYRLAYNEPFLAVTAGIAPPARYVRVLDLGTGTERSVTPGGDELALLADGTLVTDTASGIYAWPPGGLPPKRLARAEGPFALAESGVVYVSGNRARFAPIDRGPKKRIRASSSGFAPLAFDGRRAAFLHVTCDNRIRVAVVDVRLRARRPACGPRGIAG